MADWIFSVGEVNRYVQRALSLDHLLQNIRIRGEISNCKTYASGHTYFSLKDEEGVLRCCWFKSQKAGRTLALEDGLRVVAQGSISLYIRDGQFQLYVNTVEMDGIGAWYERYHRLEARLEAEGLFAAEHKQLLPRMVKRLGIITSRSGAVFHDILQVASRRQKHISMVLYPVQVQGEQAAVEIVQALSWFTAYGGVDVIILGRGGGSVEDLWCFNEEAVVRAIYACPIPIVSAVGHETDHTLSDRAADVRAATPSMAAELAVPDQRVMLSALQAIRLDMYQAMQSILEDRENALRHMERLLYVASPRVRLQEATQRTDRLEDRLYRGMDALLERKASVLQTYRIALRALDPRRVLERGYAIVTDAFGKVITSAVAPGEPVHLEVHHARLQAVITQAEEKEDISHDNGS